MAKPKIVFYGTPDFAVASLAALVDAGMDVKGVVTAPDKPAGRGKKLQSPPVKRYALEKGLQVFQPTNLKDPGFIDEIKQLQPDVQVVVAFRMMPKALWEIPPLGTFNLHASLLPQYRGAAPINWAVINGETETGNTTFLIDDQIDTGKILMQQKVAVTDNMDAGDLHDLLMEQGAQLVVDTVKRLDEGTIESTEQDTGNNTPLKDAPKLYRETCMIDWDQPADKVRNFIRGLSPFPGAWCKISNGSEEMVMKIFKTSTTEKSIASGTMLTEGKRMWIGAGGRGLEILELQVSGKRRMKTNELLNGTDLSSFKIIP